MRNAMLLLPVAWTVVMLVVLYRRTTKTPRYVHLLAALGLAVDAWVMWSVRTPDENVFTLVGAAFVLPATIYFFYWQRGAAEADRSTSPPR